MGSGNTAFLDRPTKHLDSLSGDCKAFVECFEALAGKCKRDKLARNQAWFACDNNGNTYVSLAESEKWIKETLIGSLEDVEKGTALFKRFRPSFIRAFNDAADLGKDRKITNSASTDDYVQQHEFRVFNAYLCLYAMMYDHFSLIDGKSDGVSADDDRKISLEEWKAGCAKVCGSPFIAMRRGAKASADPEVIFNAMDADKKGAVLLIEFCNYIKGEELDCDTEWADTLGIDADLTLTGYQVK